GTINSTLLTLRALKGERLRAAGIVLSAVRWTDVRWTDLAGGEDPSEGRNPAALRELTDVPLLGVLPWTREAGEWGAAPPISVPDLEARWAPLREPLGRAAREHLGGFLFARATGLPLGA
ncbi:MAG: AAA family ATPase, partial [Nitrospinota bacterium]